MTASMPTFITYCIAIISIMSRNVMVPANAMTTNGTVSSRYAMTELPMVLSHKRRLPVMRLILSISQALDNSPKRNPTSDAMTMRGTYVKIVL